MNDLQMVQTLLTEAPPSPEVVAAGRERLQSSYHRRTFQIPRPSWPVASGLGISAIAAVAAIAVATTGTAPHAPDRVDGQTYVSPSGRALLAAATIAERTPGGSGKYWHVEFRYRWFQRVGSGGGSYVIASTTRAEQWIADDPGQDSWSRSQYLGAQPASPADAAAWRKAGSPKTFHTVDGKTTTTSPERVFLEHGRVGGPGYNGGVAYGPLAEAGLARLRTLPPDPAKLKAWFLSLPKDRGLQRRAADFAKIKGLAQLKIPPPTQAEIDEWLFSQASELILSAPISPTVRGAAFRMLSTLPEVKLIGQVKDAEGRTGTAVGMAHQNVKVAGPDQLESRLILDPATGRALVRETVVVQPGDINPGLQPGDVSEYEAVLSSGWTDTAPK